MTRLFTRCLFALFLTAGAAFAQDTRPTTNPAASATVDVWPAGKMPGRATTQPEGERPPRGDGVL